LDDVTPGLPVHEANGRQFQEVADHGEEMPGVNSVAARLWGRFFFHSGSTGSFGLSGFSHTRRSGVGRGLQGKAVRLVESRCRCPQ
jgi:hypothetical protein